MQIQGEPEYIIRQLLPEPRDALRSQELICALMHRMFTEGAGDPTSPLLEQFDVSLQLWEETCGLDMSTCEDDHSSKSELPLTLCFANLGQNGVPVAEVLVRRGYIPCQRLDLALRCDFILSVVLKCTDVIHCLQGVPGSGGDRRV